VSGNSKPRTALIAGASRGLGLALAQEFLVRGWNVIATVRNAAGEGRLRALQDAGGGALEIESLDITVPEQIAALSARLAGRSLDLLFVNAGVANGPAETVRDASTEEFIRLMVTNALGPLRVIEALIGHVARGGSVAVMSSGLGSVTNNVAGGWEVYRASKAALNTLVKSYAARQAGDARTYLVIAPGWVRTDMGGPNAALGIETSIPGVVNAIEQRSGTPGVVYVDYQNQIVPW
jgi:NAD(P)-dependent dehydrogenase (short-subunit alcohol dehydrogenase family)